MSDGTRLAEDRSSLGHRTVMASGYLALDAVLYNQRATLRVGGTAGNVAANLAFFGWHASVAGRIGSDPLGLALHHGLSDARVSTDNLEVSESASTPVVFHHVLPEGPKYTFRCPGCGRKLGRHSPPKEETVEALRGASGRPDVFFFDRVSKGTLELASIARERGSLVVFEPSTLGVAHLFETAVRISHIVKYSRERAPAVEGALPRRPIGQIRIVTNGADGLAVSTRKGWRSVPSYHANVLDEAGAGDWTTSALLFALPSVVPDEIDGEIVWETASFAQAVAAMSCSFVGARGMALAWDRARVLRNAARLSAGEKGSIPRKTAAGNWVPEGELIAQLCNPSQKDSMAAPPKGYSFSMGTRQSALARE